MLYDKKNVCLNKDHLIYVDFSIETYIQASLEKENLRLTRPRLSMDPEVEAWTWSISTSSSISELTLSDLTHKT